MGRVQFTVGSAGSGVDDERDQRGAMESMLSSKYSGVPGPHPGHGGGTENDSVSRCGR